MNAKAFPPHVFDLPQAAIQMTKNLIAEEVCQGTPFEALHQFIEKELDDNA